MWFARYFAFCSIGCGIFCCAQSLNLWVPDWCKEVAGTAEDSSDDEQADKKAKKKEKITMTMLSWGIAFDRYALAAAAMGQWEYWSSRAHLENCYKVAGILLFRFSSDRPVSCFCFLQVGRPSRIESIIWHRFTITCVERSGRRRPQGVCCLLRSRLPLYPAYVLCLFR